MEILKGLEPRKVFEFFEEICSIPHGSGNTKVISDYVVKFAKDRNLKYIQDESNNVIIFKNASEGKENSPSVIIQGHLDMVCEKDADVEFDFENDGLKLEVNGDLISAKGTTLGGDDGIAVAFALAVLDDDTIVHPEIEAVFTVDEEIGLLGAGALDTTPLKSKMLLNIDSEEEGTLLVGCAGGAQAKMEIPLKRTEAEKLKLKVTVDGLLGGHSGVEIDKNRANSNMVMGRILNSLANTAEVYIIEVKGGLKDNVIPNSTYAEIAVDEKDFDALKEKISELDKILKNEYKTSDTNISVCIEKAETGKLEVFDKESTKKVIFLLNNVPNGITDMSADIENLVETSLNLGILSTEADKMILSWGVRSSVLTKKTALIEKLKNMSDFVGGEFSVSGEYPAWEYKRDSKLRDIMVEVYEKQYGKKPEVEAIHAGLECGIFCGKMPELDCVSFGPDIMDIHTSKERLSISSAKRVWEFLLNVLENL